MCRFVIELLVWWWLVRCRVLLCCLVMVWVSVRFSLVLLVLVLCEGFLRVKGLSMWLIVFFGMLGLLLLMWIVVWLCLCDSEMLVMLL